MSFQILQERLTALQETTKQVEELITRLANIKFQPGSVPLDLDDEEDNITTELSNEIHQTLKEQKEDLELLEQEVDDLAPGRPGSELQRDKAHLADKVKRAAQDLKLARSSFRKAQIVAKANLANAQREERAVLVASFSQSLSSSTDSLPVVPRRKNLSSSIELSKEDKTVNAASDVTAALRRTHILMQSELSRSEFANQTLKESTAALAQLGETYSTLDTMLSSSKNLLGTLLKSQKSDTWYLETAFWVLVTTIAWLVFRRILYGPFWWFIYFPLKLFYKAWMGVFVAVGLRSNRDGVYASDAAATTVLSESPMIVGTTSPSIIASDAPQIKTGKETAHEEGIIEEIGQIIDESQQKDSDASEQANLPNPKKRMWEEDIEAEKEEFRRKDEL